MIRKIVYALLFASVVSEFDADPLARERSDSYLVRSTRRHETQDRGSLLQKRNRVLKKLVKDFDHVSTKSFQAKSIWHVASFLVVLVVGSLLNAQNLKYLQVMLRIRSSPQTPSTETIDGNSGGKLNGSRLTDNTILLKKDPLPAALSIMNLLPDISTTALCKDGADAEPVTYSQLRLQIIASEFSAWFSYGERVALVLDNGKDMAICMLIIMQRTCVAPLNSSFTHAELAACLEQFACRVVVVRPAAEGEAARKAASGLGLRILTLSRRQGNMPVSFQGPRLQSVLEERACSKTDGPHEVLLLKTSGTTSKGKVVPFTLERLSLAARYNARCLQLSPCSVCLSMMPLYHIAGVSVNFMASMSAGATVLFHSGLFDVTRFAADLERSDAFKPTWYFAVPAVHEALLSHLKELGRPVEHKLVLIRSAGAALVQDTGLRLIETFNCAVTPAYGMTEALEITCPPMGYRLERPGSVGPSISAEIKIINGEVCVRGDLVMSGYEFVGPTEDDPNTDAWTGGQKGQGFLRTGDLGHMDDEGWLFLTGRCKEMINRGGETINPHEVELAFTSMPEIDIAVCFAAPHEALGECVALAIVLQKNLTPQQVPPANILDHCVSRVSVTMRPEIFVYLTREALPTTATKKIVRAGLAERLGLTPGFMLGSTVFVYSETDGSLRRSSLKDHTTITQDSLGQLREATKRDVVEQQLKDGLLGIGVLQVITRHWYLDLATVESLGQAFNAYDTWADSKVLFMSLFFVLSGHTASKVNTRTERFQRWAGLYVIMTLSCMTAILTNSLRVDWFFTWLLLVEMVTICLDRISSCITKAMGDHRRIVPAMGTIIIFITLAAWTNAVNSDTSELYKGFRDSFECGVAFPLTTWCNIFSGNFDFNLQGWQYGLLNLWAAGFAVGFHLLPALSTYLWSCPSLLNFLAFPSVRLSCILAVVWLISANPTWPKSVDGWWWLGKPRGSNMSDFSMELLSSLICLIYSLLTTALMAISIGPKALQLQILGKYAVGTLVSHTMFMFSKEKYPFYNVEAPWNLHDVLQFEVSADSQVLFAISMIALPVLYIRSIGKFVQFFVDMLLQVPIAILPLWLAFLSCTSILLIP